MALVLVVRDRSSNSVGDGYDYFVAGRQNQSAERRLMGSTGCPRMVDNISGFVANDRALTPVSFRPDLGPVPHRHVAGWVSIAHLGPFSDDALVVEEDFHVIDPGKRQRIAIVKVFGVVSALRR